MGIGASCRKAQDIFGGLGKLFGVQMGYINTYFLIVTLSFTKFSSLIFIKIL
jgi:hypothetical protein